MVLDSVVRAGRVTAGVLAAAGLAATVSACASSSGSQAAANAASTSTVRSVPMVPGPSPSDPTSIAVPVPATSPVNPGGRMSPAPVPAGTPAGQVVEAPSNAKYVPIDQETQSADGRTLHLQIEAHGGACGQYLVVLQQSPTAVHVGLAQLPVRKGVMCPMFIGPRLFSTTLSSPLGSRPLLDLANGARLNP